MREISLEFKCVWESEIKPLAIKCSPKNVFAKIKELENVSEGTERFKELERELQETNINDLYAVYHIGIMIGHVEHALIRGEMDMNVFNSLSQVQRTLNSSSYWKNVWNDDCSSEEAQNLDALGKNILKLINLC